MSLIPCPECQNQVSDRAVSCVHCGFPFSEIKTEQLPLHSELDERAGTSNPASPEPTVSETVSLKWTAPQEAETRADTPQSAAKQHASHEPAPSEADQEELVVIPEPIAAAPQESGPSPVIHSEPAKEIEKKEDQASKPEERVEKIENETKEKNGPSGEEDTRETPDLDSDLEDSSGSAGQTGKAIGIALIILGILVLIGGFFMMNQTGYIIAGGGFAALVLGTILTIVATSKDGTRGDRELLDQLDDLVPASGKPSKFDTLKI